MIVVDLSGGAVVVIALSLAVQPAVVVGVFVVGGAVEVVGEGVVGVVGVIGVAVVGRAVAVFGVGLGGGTGLAVVVGGLGIEQIPFLQYP